MKCFQFLVLSFLSVGISGYYVVSSAVKIENEQENCQPNVNNDTLIAAHVIYRHGARNIDFVFPNDPYKDEKHWIGGIGQLTNEGKEQQYELGRYLRQRYDRLLGTDKKYSAKKVYIRSTDVDRTLMSAQANLAGLYFPADDEKWNSEILWQPIPIHTVPKSLDYLLYSIVECPKYAALRETYPDESKEVQRIYTEYANTFSFLSRMTGVNITTMYDVYMVYDTLNVERHHNKSLSEWAINVIRPGSIAEYIATYDFKTYTDTQQMARLISGFLFKEMLQQFSEKVNDSTDRSVWIYSAHDFTITNLLNALGLYELHIPPYSSSLHFELFKTDESKHYVLIFYRKFGNLTLMKIPKCGEKCPLQQLYQIYNDIIPGDFHTECLI